MKDEVKFLGLVFDKKLNFKAHIKHLKEKCRKALNILRVVGHTDWPCGYGALHQRGVKNDTHRLPVARETV